MSFKRFLISRAFIINLTIAILLVVALLFLTLQGLKSYTRHGQANPVPNFTGMLKQQAEITAKQHNLEVRVIDSVYTNSVGPGEVVEQEPNAGFKVKDNRTIFLTVNSTNKEMVALPKLTEISFRQAQVLVESYGFKIGEISYQPSEYNNLVLKVEQDSTEISEGKLILKGSKIDFIVGRDPENEQTPLPNLKGLQIEPAKEILTDAMLNLGVLLFDETILTKEDTLNATIWQQRPEPKSKSTVTIGTSIDLWVTVDKTKIDTVEEQGF